MRYVLACALACGCLWAEKVEIVRDEFGVPHIFAATPAGAAYGAGYAQAQDRLEELLKNYRKAEGSMSEAFGERWSMFDYRQKLWRHRAVAEENYPKLSANIRAMCEAYQKGVARYMEEHPKEVPAWAPKLAPWQIVALGRYIIFGWPEGEIAGELTRVGIRPDPPAYRGSNEMAIAPSRTAMHAPIAVIDPHLSWYGEFRFYEMRMYAKGLAVSGAAILGLPMPSLGHNRDISVANTTGGPDTSDVYEEEVRDGKYRFKDEWRPLMVRREKIGGKEVVIESTHHGPIVAHKDGKAYSAAIPYANEYRLIEQNWRVMTARNLAEVKDALAMLQLMQQNVMVATTGGDIYYVRNGRVPVRPAGCDPSKPMPGATGECEWQGLHPFADLIQVTNPPQGYMQNNNTSPEWMMKDSPMTPDRYKDRPYLFNFAPGPPHQRAAMSLEELSKAEGVTVERAMRLAFSTGVFGAEKWQERIRKASPEPSEFVKLLVDWDRRMDADSRGAMGFYLFKKALPEKIARAFIPPAEVTDEQIVAALAAAGKRLSSEFAPGAVWGSYFRVGREGSDRNWPVGGGSLIDAGMAAPRAVSYSKKGEVMVGHTGQTSTQIVILTKPPQSFMVIPLGESDHKDSGHWEDQAGKLFSKATAKSTYFLRRGELMKHQTGVLKLQF
ncbi:MAG: penicillin acylase family protein [Acidobacteria bacterium]|nr:penicillin acylase family protein [Acidobacteriota bacterium]